MTGQKSRTTWQRHGYIFSALFGACMVAVMIGGLRLAGIDPDSTAYDHPWWFSVLFLCGGAAAVIVSYYIALAVSDAIHRIWQHLRRAFSRSA